MFCVDIHYRALSLAEFDALETTCRGLAQDKVLSAIGAAQCPTEEP
jgi:hypothetical protein